jgi:DNA (cytosine-5)-methyltransferase 1
MAAYYNEIDPFAVQWLRNLIAKNLIAPGDVDERSIRDVKPDDLRNYTQCHFFAGIGVWSYALRLAGWPDDRPVWTGSCPCQPFSAAGKQQGTSDERHLWPAWFNLIRQCQPRVVFGEQVEAAIRHGWLDLVQTDLEGVGYAVAAAGIPAAGFGAPHIRQRLWFVADSAAGSADDAGRGGVRVERQQMGEATGGMQSTSREQRVRIDAGDGFDFGRLGNNNNTGLEGQRSGHQTKGGRDGAVRSATSSSESGGVADIPNAGHERRRSSEAGNGRDTARLESERLCDVGRPGPTNGHWRDADWLHCRDGKWRPVEPGTFPLAHGAPARVGRLRAYGNAINAETAAAFIEAYLGR